MTNGFPPGFTWGAATASYQVEGAVSTDGRGPSIWDTFARTPGKISDGTTGDVADDHYHRFADDIRLLADLGLTAYRFSVAWPRIVPAGSGDTNQAGLDFYRRLAETCLEYGVTPYATLYHWDLPQPLEDAGGWLVRDTAERFRDYAAITHSALSDVIKHWMTLNEPWCSAFLGYGNGEHAPGRTEGADALKAVHHLLLGHGLALDALRSSGDGTYGIALNPAPIHAASDSPADRDAARRIDGLRNRMFLEPLLSGHYPADVLEDTGMTEWFAAQEADLPVIAAPLDFIGVNYYCPTTVAAPSGPISAPVPSTQPGSENVAAVDTGLPKTQMGWPIEAAGLRDILVTINKMSPDLPLYVTENGSAYPDVLTTDGTVEDDDRLAYLQQHLEVCRQLVSEGFPLKGYFAWSLMDNFEWAWGYSRRFGIVYVDYETQTRTPKKSALWLKDFLS